MVESKGLIFIKITRENSALYVYYICPKHRDKGAQRSSLSAMRKARYGCKYCAGKEKTTDDFKKELYAINPNITILGEYESAKTKILCECLIDGIKWSTTPNGLLRGSGCPECGRIASNINSSKTTQQFEQELYQVSPEIQLVGEYTGIKSKMQFKCVNCGYEWITTGDSVLNQQSGCPQCLKKKQHDSQVKSNSQFLQELYEANPMLLPLEPYYNDHTKIKMKCLVHDYIWDVAPNKILHRNTGCPKCISYTNENKISSFFMRLGYTVVLQKRYSDCKDKKTLPFDIYVVELNLLIEYQGEQHYKPIRRGSMSEYDAKLQLDITQSHDKIKKEYCKNNKIPFIEVPYWENKNLESFLMQKMQELNLI